MMWESRVYPATISKFIMLPPLVCNIPKIVEDCFFSDVSCRMRQRPCVRQSKKCGSLEKGTLCQSLDVQCWYYHANSSFFNRWSVVSTGLHLSNAEQQNVDELPFCWGIDNKTTIADEWTVVSNTLHVVSPWFIWDVNCSAVARRFTRMKRGTFCSLLSSMTCGHHKFDVAYFLYCHFAMHGTLLSWQHAKNLVSTMLILFVWKAINIPFCMPDKSFPLYMTITNEMFIKILQRTLHTH